MCNKCDETKDKLSDRLKTLDKTWIVKSFSENTNPFISATFVSNGIEKNRKEIKKFFTKQAEVFQKRYDNLKNGTVFNSFLIKNFNKSENPVTEEDLLTIANTTFDQDEFYNLLVQIFWEDFADEYSEKLSEWLEDFWVAEVIPIVHTVSAEKKQRMRNIYSNFSDTLMKKATAILKDTIVFWIEDWLSIPKIVKELTWKIKWLWKKRAEVIARTETIRVSAMVSQDKYNQMWIEKYEILPATNCCPVCRKKADKNPYKMDDNIAIPPVHPNCRCSIIPVIDWLDFE